MSVSRTTLRDIREALARLDKERETFAARIVEIDKQADALRVTHEYLAQLHEEAQTDVGIPAVPAKNLRNEMVQILRDTGKPLHYTELRNQLETREVVINGADKAKTVGAHLSNDPRFKKLGRGMWALTSWPASVATLDNADDTGHVDTSDDTTGPEEYDDPFDAPSQTPPHPMDIAFSEEVLRQTQRPQRPQRPQAVRPAAPGREEAFASEEFDDVPF